MSLKRIYVAPGIIHLKFNNHNELTKTFLRFQEHYESPKFRGKIFTLAEFKRWYKADRKSKTFTYYTDWSGFNIPSKVLVPFKSGLFDPLSSREKRLLDALSLDKGKFYIIGTYESKSSGTLDHEIAHALYYTDKNYKAEIDKALKGVDFSPIRKKLMLMGYCKEVLPDETHAFLLGSKEHIGERFGVVGDECIAARKQLIDIFKRYKKMIDKNKV